MQVFVDDSHMRVDEKETVQTLLYCSSPRYYEKRKIVDDDGQASGRLWDALWRQT